MPTDIGYTRAEVSRAASRLSIRNPRIDSMILAPGDTRATITLGGGGDLLAAVRDLQTVVCSHEVIASACGETRGEDEARLMARIHAGLTAELTQLVTGDVGTPLQRFVERQDAHVWASDRAAELIAEWFRPTRREGET